MTEELENKEVTESEQSTEEKQGRFYTDDEIRMIEQKAGDKRISQYQRTLEKKQRETSRLQNMSQEERYQYELDQREKEIAERESKLVLAENRAACISILADKGIDSSLVDLVVAETAEEMDSRIKLIDKAFKKSVKAEVEKRLQGTSPKKNLAEPEGMTKSDLMKMNVRDLQMFKNQNPDVWASIMGNQ